MHRGGCRGGCGRPRGNVPCRHGAGAGADADGAAEGDAGAAARSPCGTPAHRTAPLAATQNCGGCERGAGQRGQRGQRREEKGWAGGDGTARDERQFPASLLFLAGGAAWDAPLGAGCSQDYRAVVRGAQGIAAAGVAIEGCVGERCPRGETPRCGCKGCAARAARAARSGAVWVRESKTNSLLESPAGNVRGRGVPCVCALLLAVLNTPLRHLGRPVAVPDKLRPAAAVCQFVPWRSACSCGGLAKWCCFWWVAFVWVAFGVWVAFVVRCSLLENVY